MTNKKNPPGLLNSPEECGSQHKAKDPPGFVSATTTFRDQFTVFAGVWDSTGSPDAGYWLYKKRTAIYFMYDCRQVVIMRSSRIHYHRRMFTYFHFKLEIHNRLAAGLSSVPSKTKSTQPNKDINCLQRLELRVRVLSVLRTLFVVSEDPATWG